MVAQNCRDFPEIPHKINKIHIIGVVGTAMGTLGAMLKEQGYQVQGSDAGGYPPMTLWLEKRQIPFKIGYNAQNLDWNPDLVIIGNVVRATNPEAIETQRRQIPYISLAEALNHFFIQKTDNLVITGTHGKTTTTSLLAWILFCANSDPSFFIGGVTGNFESNYRLGSGNLFAIEGDEYDTAFFDKVPKFWHYKPKLATINNIEFDHADIYSNLDEIISVFSKFASLLPTNGSLWINGDDDNCLHVATHTHAKVGTFGLSSHLDLHATNITYTSDTTSFDLIHHGDKIAHLTTSLPGDFNVRNILGATAIALDLGVDPQVIKESVATFKTTQKRQQLIANVHEIKIFDDFAHHPTAVAQTIAAFRKRFPHQRIIVAFEAKSNTSHRAIFQNEYAAALAQADHVILSKAWKKVSLPPEQLLNFDKLINDIQNHNTPIELIPDIDDIVERLVDLLQPHDIFLGLSGSAFDNLHTKLADRLKTTQGGSL